ncbi:MAG: AraC family transcriptional regulator [Motiliproteus sp.]
MSGSKDKRLFSASLQDANSAFLLAEKGAAQPIRVGFILLDYFSLQAFTAAVDALVTANLVRTRPLFEFTTYGIGSLTAKSDLGINISTSGLLDQLHVEGDDFLDILIVCGGFRCALTERPILTAKLKAATRKDCILGTLWNGTIALAQAGLLDDQECTLHLDNHAFVKESLPRVGISDLALVVEANRATSAGPSSALEMMLVLIERSQGKDTVRAIREILSSDQIAENPDKTLLQSGSDP